jgi:hypothetical protein
MKKLLFLGGLLLTISNLFCQHPNYDKYVYKYIDHKFDNYQTPEISNAIFLLNGDSIEYAWDKNNRGLGYAIPKERIVLKNKFNITHPDYNSLILDSAYFIGHYPLYLFQEGEEAYIEDGMPIALNYGKKYIAIKVSKKNYSSEEAKQLANKICRKFKLRISVSYQDSLKKSNRLYGAAASEIAYGCLESELNYIFWFEKEDSSIFHNKNIRYKKIRKNKSVEWLGIPQDYHSYILDGFEIEFETDAKTMRVNALLEKYKLETLINKSNSASGYTIYSLKNEYLIPNNDLIKSLMRESIVKHVRIRKMIYATCCN